jgi:hypothetical protein
MTCFGVTLITGNIAVVDCVDFNGAILHHYTNHYYIVSTAGLHTLESEKIANCYLNYKPYARKTVKYDTSHEDLT